MLAFLLLIFVAGIVVGAAGHYTIQQIAGNRKISVLAVDDEETLSALKDKLGQDAVIVKSNNPIHQTDIKL